MNPILRKQCELLVENRKTVSSVFWGDFNILRITCAALYAGKNCRADDDSEGSAFPLTSCFRKI